MLHTAVLLLPLYTAVPAALTIHTYIQSVVVLCCGYKGGREEKKIIGRGH